MIHALLSTQVIDEAPAQYLSRIGEVFARFDERTQDSGNLSFGVRIDAERFFVKTAGMADESSEPRLRSPALGHAARVGLLRNAVRLHQAVQHPALARLRGVVESPTGPMLVFDWFEGESLRVPEAERANPDSAYQRFRALPVARICACLDQVFDLHVQLARAGWIASDFYDGSLMYDFASDRLTVFDLDQYADGPFNNAMGRMFGSTRFMAPEEFQLGARIDQRTNVFTMGRAGFQLLGDETLTPAAFRGTQAMFAVLERACQLSPAARFVDMASFTAAWRRTMDPPR